MGNFSEMSSEEICQILRAALEAPLTEKHQAELAQQMAELNWSRTNPSQHNPAQSQECRTLIVLPGFFRT